MKQTSRMNTRLLLGALLLGISLHPFALPGDARAVQMTFVSDAADPLWTVSDTKGNPLGSPQNVCYNATAPSNCPAGATKYGFPGNLPTDLSSIPGAKWIWAPGVTGKTSPAANEEFTFEHMFFVCGEPKSGSISVTADDSTEVFLNGSPTPVLTTTGGFNVLSAKNIPANSISRGINLIKVKAKNAYLDWCKNTDNYQCNPAAVVFGASFADSLPELPKCTGNNGRIFTAGQVETLPCPPGEIGSNYRLCACADRIGFWWNLPSSCKRPPVTCAGTNGKTYEVNQSEALPCPAPKVGSASHTCQANGTWGPTDSSTCKMTCTGINGKTYEVNQSEALPCPAPKVGSASHTCQANGTWGSPNYSTCTLPKLNEGDICLQTRPDYIEFGICPDGTECTSRTTCYDDCWFFGLFCDRECLVSTVSYCDPK